MVDDVDSSLDIVQSSIIGRLRGLKLARHQLGKLKAKAATKIKYATVQEEDHGNSPGGRRAKGRSSSGGLQHTSSMELRILQKELQTSQSFSGYGQEPSESTQPAHGFFMKGFTMKLAGAEH